MLDECYVVISHGPVLHSVLCTVSSHPCALHCIRSITCARAVVAVVLHAVAGRLDRPGEGLAPCPGDSRHGPRQHRGGAGVVVVVVDVEVAAHIPPQRTIIVIVN